MPHPPTKLGSEGKEVAAILHGLMGNLSTMTIGTRVSLTIKVGKKTASRSIQLQAGLGMTAGTMCHAM